MVRTKIQDTVEQIAAQHHLDMLKASRDAQFPACLDKSLASIFSSTDTILSLVKKAGFKPRQIISFRDERQYYLDILNYLKEILGNDVSAVIESKTLEVMETLPCKECPLYKMEMERKRDGFSKPLPTTYETAND